jgi:hypothetical protein
VLKAKRVHGAQFVGIQHDLKALFSQGTFRTPILPILHDSRSHEWT